MTGLRHAFLIGSPVAHSKSPMIFEFLAERLGARDIRYVAREVTRDNLSAVVTSARQDQSFMGMNVTVPHKEAIVAFMDELSDEARDIGAVNTVVAHDGRMLRGYNTDAIAVRQLLQDIGCDPAEKDVAVWGAGGAARAVLHALGHLGTGAIWITNRDMNRAREVAQRFGALFPRTRFVVGAPDRPVRLIVNATSVGMQGIPAAQEPHEFFAGVRSLRREARSFAFDVIYAPERTPFLAIASAAGYEVIGGIPMLIGQALATWELWFGEIDAAFRAQLNRDLALRLREPLHTAPIFLTGFMGVGKTTVGQALAAALGRDFMDTDSLVEQEEGARVVDIFRARGEAGFRELEKRALLRAASLPATVISLGGGALLDADSQELVKRTGTLVYLTARPETLARRLAPTADTRPLLAGSGSLKARTKRIRELLHSRESAFSGASFAVETDSRTVGEVVEEITRVIRAEQ